MLRENDYKLLKYSWVPALLYTLSYFSYYSGGNFLFQSLKVLVDSFTVTLPQKIVYGELKVSLFSFVSLIVLGGYEFVFRRQYVKALVLSVLILFYCVLICSYGMWYLRSIYGEYIFVIHPWLSFLVFHLLFIGVLRGIILKSVGSIVSGIIAGVLLCGVANAMHWRQYDKILVFYLLFKIVYIVLWYFLLFIIENVIKDKKIFSMKNVDHFGVYYLILYAGLFILIMGYCLSENTPIEDWRGIRLVNESFSIFYFLCYMVFFLLMSVALLVFIRNWLIGAGYPLGVNLIIMLLPVAGFLLYWEIRLKGKYNKLKMFQNVNEYISYSKRSQLVFKVLVSVIGVLSTTVFMYKNCIDMDSSSFYNSPFGYGIFFLVIFGFIAITVELKGGLIMLGVANFLWLLRIFMSPDASLYTTLFQVTMASFMILIIHYALTLPSNDNNYIESNNSDSDTFTP